jgi:hypothetical protein
MELGFDIYNGLWMMVGMHRSVLFMTGPRSARHALFCMMGWSRDGGDNASRDSVTNKYKNNGKHNHLINFYFVFNSCHYSVFYANILYISTLRSWHSVLFYGTTKVCVSQTTLVGDRQSRPKEPPDISCVYDTDCMRANPAKIYRYRTSQMQAARAEAHRS